MFIVAANHDTAAIVMQINTISSSFQGSNGMQGPIGAVGSPGDQVTVPVILSMF